MGALTVILPIGPPPRRYLPATLDSLTQEFPSSNAEIHAIFDGSQPTPTEEERLSTIDAKVSCIPKSPHLAQVLNFGLHVVETELVGRLDADDLWLPGRLSAQVKLMATHPDCVLAGSDALTIDAAGTPIGRLSAGHAPDLRKALLARNQMLHPTVVFRTEPALRVGGYPNFPRVEDYALWLALARKGRVMNTCATWVAYRMHSQQLSRSSVDPEGKRVIAQKRRLLAKDLNVSCHATLLRRAAWEFAQAPLPPIVRRAWSRQ